MTHLLVLAGRFINMLDLSITGTEVYPDLSVTYAGISLDTDVACSGRETSLEDCSVNQTVGPGCTNPTAAASVRCIIEGMALQAVIS